jgi:predicted transcriptional regulator
MTPVTKKHQQLILLEPEQALSLDELAAETRIPKQVLLREAVTDLLGKHGKSSSEFIDAVVDALEVGLVQAEARFKIATGKINGTGAVPKRASEEAIAKIEKLLDLLKR